MLNIGRPRSLNFLHQTAEVSADSLSVPTAVLRRVSAPAPFQSNSGQSATAKGGLLASAEGVAAGGGGGGSTFAMALERVAEGLATGPVDTQVPGTWLNAAVEPLQGRALADEKGTEAAAASDPFIGSGSLNILQ